MKQNKKRATIIDVITLLQNQPNDTGQYLYWVADNSDKYQNAASGKRIQSNVPKQSPQKFVKKGQGSGPTKLTIKTTKKGQSNSSNKSSPKSVKKSPPLEKKPENDSISRYALRFLYLRKLLTWSFLFLVF